MKNTIPRLPNHSEDRTVSVFHMTNVHDLLYIFISLPDMDAEQS